MRTHSSSNLPVESPPNPSTSNPKHRNRKRSKQPFILEESPVDTMVDQCTMAELLHAPTKGYAEEIVFFELEKDNPHDHIHWFNKITSTIKYKDVPNSAIKLMLFPFSLAGAAHRWIEKEPPCSILTWEDLVSKFINEFFPSSRTTNLSSVKAVEEICVTCGDAHPYYQRLAAEQSYQALTQPNQVVPLSKLEKVKRMNEAKMKAMQTQINIVKNELRNEKKNSIQASMSNQTNELKNMMASFFQMNTASTSGFGSLPSNTIANTKGELKAITTESGIVLDGPFVPMPPLFINPKEDECVEETLMYQDLVEYTIKVPPPLV
nr:reverse transcriptase domain-containing protein [Tanacetum cinerariifolium]